MRLAVACGEQTEERGVARYLDPVLYPSIDLKIILLACLRR